MARNVWRTVALWVGSRYAASGTGPVTMAGPTRIARVGPATRFRLVPVFQHFASSAYSPSRWGQGEVVFAGAMITAGPAILGSFIQPAFLKFGLQESQG